MEMIAVLGKYPNWVNFREMQSWDKIDIVKQRCYSGKLIYQYFSDMDNFNGFYCMGFIVLNRNTPMQDIAQALFRIR